MEETVQLSVIRAKVSLVTELDCVDDVEPIANAVVHPLLECEHRIRGKNKKKKKKQNGIPSPRRIVGFDSDELSKIDEEKMEPNKIDEEKMEPNKSALQQVSSTIEADILLSDSKKTKGGVDRHSERFSSSPQKSALRGAHEKLGFGPRPKMHVKWASSVWEPPSSISSHTVNKNQPQKGHSKKDKKHGHSARSNSHHNHKKQAKKKSQVTTNRNFVKSDREQPPGDTMTANDPLFECDAAVGYGSLENELGNTEGISFIKESAKHTSNSGKSACAASVMGYYTPCSLVYGQAM